VETSVVFKRLLLCHSCQDGRLPWLRRNPEPRPPSRLHSYRPVAIKTIPKCAMDLKKRLAEVGALQRCAAVLSTLVVAGGGCVAHKNRNTPHASEIVLLSCSASKRIWRASASACASTPSSPDERSSNA